MGAGQRLGPERATPEQVRNRNWGGNVDSGGEVSERENDEVSAVVPHLCQLVMLAILALVLYPIVG